ncbi:hydrocephalus-inducing protein homolog [Anabrus simplex]|uniref:hydrocephalus-inducing protein homolog n=1 Tax=Anabrus simplex TaxID=316456 RepID=UPI0035A2BFFE
MCNIEKCQGLPLVADMETSSMISCLGVKIEFEVEPKNISFEHILLYRKDFRILTLANKSLVPLIWHFLGVETIQDDFTVSDTEGLLMPLNKQEVRFDFSADEVKPYFKRQLKLEVFDEEGRGESLFTETITLSAEAIDVMVDVLFGNEGVDYIDFGKVKVGNEYQQPFQLRNKGKYDIVCKVEVEVPTETSVPRLDEMISVLPHTGTVVHGEKPFQMLLATSLTSDRPTEQRRCGYGWCVVRQLCTLQVS